MMKYSLLGLTLAFIFTISLIGCSSVTDTPINQATVQASASNLPALDNSAYYELWISYSKSRTDIKNPQIDHEDASFVSVGKFRVTETGGMVNLEGGAATFALPSSVDATKIEDAVLTVQSTSAPDTAPTARLLAGSFDGLSGETTAHLEISGDDAFGSAYELLGPGRFVLDMPTTADTTDFESGIWFGRLLSGQFLNGLVLPTVPLNDENPDWIYRAWLAHTLTGGTIEYINLGAFHSTEMPDDNGAGPGAGTLTSTAYMLPGEDFAVAGQTRTLNDGTYGVIVSLEASNVMLSHPLFPILSVPTIPTTLTRLQTATLAPAMEDAHVHVVVKR